MPVRRTVDQIDERDIRIEYLETENEELRRSIKELAENQLTLQGVMQARMFLLIAAFAVGARAVLMIWEPPEYKLILDGVFSVGVLVLVGNWIWNGWKELHWMLIPYCLVVFDAVFLAVFFPKAIYAVLGAFLFGCTRTCEVVFSKLLIFLEGIYERRQSQKSSRPDTAGAGR